MFLRPSCKFFGYLGTALHKKLRGTTSIKKTSWGIYQGRELVEMMQTGKSTKRNALSVFRNIAFQCLILLRTQSFRIDIIVVQSKFHVMYITLSISCEKGC